MPSTLSFTRPTPQPARGPFVRLFEALLPFFRAFRAQNVVDVVVVVLLGPVQARKLTLSCFGFSLPLNCVHIRALLLPPRALLRLRRCCLSRHCSLSKHYGLSTLLLPLQALLPFRRCVLLGAATCPGSTASQGVAASSPSPDVSAGVAAASQGYAYSRRRRLSSLLPCVTP